MESTFLRKKVKCPCAQPLCKFLKIPDTKPARKVDVASDNVNSNDEVEKVEEVDNSCDERRQKTKVSSNIEVDMFFNNQ